MMQGDLTRHATNKTLAQAPAFVALLTLLALVTARALSAGGEALKDLYLIYSSPLLVMLAMLWLWAGVVRWFERAHVRYDVCFSAPDQRFLLASSQLAQAAAMLTLCTAASGTLFAGEYAAGNLNAAGAQPRLLYLALACLLVLPLRLLFVVRVVLFSSAAHLQHGCALALQM